jgi:hypothetical protein
VSRPTLDEFRHELGRLAAGKSDEELAQLQEQVEWLARFAIQQALGARAARERADLLKSA